MTGDDGVIEATPGQFWIASGATLFHLCWVDPVTMRAVSDSWVRAEWPAGEVFYA